MYTRLFIWSSELNVSISFHPNKCKLPFQKVCRITEEVIQNLPARFCSLWSSANFLEAGSYLLHPSRWSPAIVRVKSVLQNKKQMPCAFPQITAGTPVRRHGNPPSGGPSPPSFNNFFLISIWRRRKHLLLPFI